MDYLTIISGITSILGLSGCGILFYKQERARKEIANKGSELANEASTNAEWIKLYKEVKDDLNVQRDAKIELRNEIADLRVQVAQLEGWRCSRTNCTKRIPPSAVTMTDDHTND